jgi:hypothetical protein
VRCRVVVQCSFERGENIIEEKKRERGRVKKWERRR